MPDGAGWLVLVADLTGLPAVARITSGSTSTGRVCRSRRTSRRRTAPRPPTRGLPAACPVAAPVGSIGDSALAEVVRGIAWPEGPGYFWMAGESAQMREIRQHLRHEVGSPARRTT